MKKRVLKTMRLPMNTKEATAKEQFLKLDIELSLI